MEIDVTLDPTASLTETDTPNAEIVPSADGLYRRVVFTDEEKERVKAFLKLSIAKSNEDYEGVWNKRNSNKRAYEALSDKGENITLPWCRQMTNQQHAWLIDTFFSKDPILNCKPLGDSKYNTVVKNPDTGLAEQRPVTGVDQADGLKKLVNYKWRHRLPMRKVLSDFAMEALQDGSVPALLKIIYDEQHAVITERAAPYEALDQETGEPKKNEKGQKLQIINSPAFRTVIKNECVRIINVPGEKLIKPIAALDLQESPWIAMEMEDSVGERRRKIASGRYDFCLPEGQEPTKEQIELVLYGTENPDERPSAKSGKAAKESNKQQAVNPLEVLITYEVYFRWPILEKPEEGESDEIVWTECCGDYDPRSGELLCCWVLDSWNGERPFIDWFAKQRPNSYSGTCTTEDVAPYQRYASNLFHLQVQNMVMRNVSVFFVRKGSATASFLKGRKLKPGMVVEFDEPDDVKPVPLGTPIESMANEISFLKSGAQEMSLVTQYDNATADLSRVTAGAFSQQQDLAKMQPELIYDSFCEAVSRLALMYVQYLIQYAPEQKLPSFDEETDAIIDNILHLPREMVTNEDFAFTATATAREDSNEVAFQKDVQVAGQVNNANNFLLTALSTIMKPNVPPPFVQLGLKAIMRSEAALKAQLKHTRQDLSVFTIEPQEIMQAIVQLMQLQQQMAEQQANPAPKVAVSLSGKLTPEQEIAAAQQQGIGGQSGPVPDAGGGGAISPSPGGPQGLPQVPPQLSNQGVPPQAPG